MATRILLIAHGHLAAGLLDSAAMICGDVGNALAVPFEVGQSPEDLHDQVDPEVPEDGQVLFLVDLPGGTPARVATEYAAHGRAEVVTGANLPMVIEAVMAAETHGPSELAQLAVDKAREGVIDAGRMIRDALREQQDGSSGP